MRGRVRKFSSLGSTFAYQLGLINKEAVFVKLELRLRLVLTYRLSASHLTPHTSNFGSLSLIRKLSLLNSNFVFDSLLPTGCRPRNPHLAPHTSHLTPRTSNYGLLSSRSFRPRTSHLAPHTSNYGSLSSLCLRSHTRIHICLIYDIHILKYLIEAYIWS